MAHSLPPESVAKGSGSVLVVDDEELVRTSTSLQLESLGYTPVAEGSPIRALEILRARHSEFVALVVDMVMPEYSGLEFAALARDIAPTLPIIFVSGFPRTDQIHFESIPGFSGYLQKPFTQASLGRSLSQAIA